MCVEVKCHRSVQEANLSPSDAVSILMNPAQLIKTFGPIWHMVTSWVLFSKRLLFCFRICANTKTVIDNNNSLCFQMLRKMLKRICLKQVGTLPWSQATDILDQALSVRVSDSLVYVHPDLVHTVDEFTVKSRE